MLITLWTGGVQKKSSRLRITSGKGKIPGFLSLDFGLSKKIDFLSVGIVNLATILRINRRIYENKGHYFRNYSRNKRIL
jgi:hypothetical protein